MRDLHRQAADARRRQSSRTAPNSATASIRRVSQIGPAGSVLSVARDQAVAALQHDSGMGRKMPLDWEAIHLVQQHARIAAGHRQSGRFAIVGTGKACQSSHQSVIAAFRDDQNQLLAYRRRVRSRRGVVDRLEMQLALCAPAGGHVQMPSTFSEGPDRAEDFVMRKGPSGRLFHLRCRWFDGQRESWS